MRVTTTVQTASLIAGLVVIYAAIFAIEAAKSRL